MFMSIYKVSFIYLTLVTLQSGTGRSTTSLQRFFTALHSAGSALSRQTLTSYAECGTYDRLASQESASYLHPEQI